MITIKKATADDLKSIAVCHQKAFPKALSSAMGIAYLCKMLEWYLVDDRAFLFFIKQEGVCYGYCGGIKVDGSGRDGSASSMLQHSFMMAVKTFLLRPWLFLHPEFISKYKLTARNVFKRLKGKSGKLPENSQLSVEKPGLQTHAGLIVIGVDSAFQGKGYGSKLLKEFEEVAVSFGFTRLSLTVKTDNHQAIKAYSRNGWTIAQTSGTSTRMKKSLSI